MITMVASEPPPPSPPTGMRHNGPRIYECKRAQDSATTLGSATSNRKHYGCGRFASGSVKGNSRPQKKMMVPETWEILISTLLQRTDVFLHMPTRRHEQGHKSRARTLCQNAVLGCNTKDGATLALRQHAERLLCNLNEAVLMRVSLLATHQEFESEQKWAPRDAVAASSSELAYLTTHMKVLDAFFAIDFEALERVDGLRKLVIDLQTELSKERITMESLQRTYIREVKRAEFLETLIEENQTERRALLEEIADLKKQLLVQKQNKEQHTPAETPLRTQDGIEEYAGFLIQSLRDDKLRLENQMRSALSATDVMAASLSSVHTECNRLQLLKEQADCKVEEANMRAELAEKSLVHDERHLKELEFALNELSDARVQIQALIMQKVEDEEQTILERQLREQAEIKVHKITKECIDAQALADYEQKVAEKLREEVAILRQNLVDTNHALNNLEAVKSPPRALDDLDRLLREDLGTISARFMKKFTQISGNSVERAMEHTEEITRPQRVAGIRIYSDMITPVASHSRNPNATLAPAPAPAPALVCEALSPELHGAITDAALSLEVDAHEGSKRTAKNWAARQRILDETIPVAKSKIKWDFRARKSQLPSEDHFQHLPCAKPRVLMPKTGKIVDLPVHPSASSHPVASANMQREFYTPKAPELDQALKKE